MSDSYGEPNEPWRVISDYENGYWDGYHNKEPLLRVQYGRTPEYILGYEDGKGDKDSDYSRHFDPRFSFSALDLNPLS